VPKAVELFETDMDGTMKEVVTRIERKSVAASEYEIPQGHKKVNPPMMDRMEK
jgi:hypothetical protein